MVNLDAKLAHVASELDALRGNLHEAIGRADYALARSLCVDLGRATGRYRKLLGALAERARASMATNHRTRAARLSALEEAALHPDPDHREELVRRALIDGRERYDPGRDDDPDG